MKDILKAICPTKMTLIFCFFCIISRSLLLAEELIDYVLIIEMVNCKYHIQQLT